MQGACAEFEDDNRTLTVMGRIVDVIKWKAQYHADVIGNEGGIDHAKSFVPNDPQMAMSLIHLTCFLNGRREASAVA